jgi:hypothetical protein
MEYTIQEIVLFNIARNQKVCSIDEIISLTGNSLDRKQVFNAVDSLIRRNLVKNKEGIILNLKNLERIKKILNDRWEDSWEISWKKIGEENAK